ncbi:MAG TPA: alanine--tRNA ligase, partial [Thermoanaerobaculia bacterium]|nr:alanine--tRNA ligase [Thermoanaerobaculia bacterium]
FMQYDRDANGVLTPLPAPSVDTGAGLERLAAVLQNVYSNYDTDLFRPVIDAITKRSGHPYTASFESDLDTAVRVLCDHVRAATFLIADGVIPSTEGRGYVLRRIIRRAIRFGRKLPNEVRLSHLVDALLGEMGSAYPEIVERRPAVMQTLEAEEERFARTLSVGMERVGDLLDEVRRRGERTLAGEEVFRLYDTYGIPLDFVQELGEEEGVKIDHQGFEEMMKAQRAKAKASSRFQAADVDVFAAIAERIGPTEFVGYDRYIDVETEVGALVREGREAERLDREEEGDVIISPTPFYAESGGQIGDAGVLEWEGGRAEVIDTQKPVGELVVSRVRVLEGSLDRGDRVRASVPVRIRLATTSNHTATHLVHKALKEILGETVQQAGSLVAPDRLRFDYTWGKPLTDQQVQSIEDLVNEKIRENIEVEKRVVSMAEAKQQGAIAMFGEKYGDQVRVVSAGQFSRELCGGCHVDRTGDIGMFKIVSDRSLAAGVRRMEAVTGPGALDYVRELETSARTLQSRLNVPLSEIPSAVESLQEKQRELEKELKSLRLKLASAGVSGGASRPEEEAIEIEGVKLLARRVDHLTGGDLRNLADTFRSKIHSGVVIIGSAHEGKATLLAAVTPDVSGRISAHALIQKLAPIVGGRGGGKPDLAQAGGKDPDRIDDALAQAQAVIREMLSVPA